MPVSCDAMLSLGAGFATKANGDKVTGAAPVPLHADRGDGRADANPPTCAVAPGNRGASRRLA
jgi:hypothetical protein